MRTSEEINKEKRREEGESKRERKVRTKRNQDKGNVGERKNQNK